MRATDCHSASAVCTPSRYALMTGRYAWRGPLKNFVLMGHGPALIEPSRPTLANLLQSNGYATGAFGKWHLGLGWRHRDGTVRDAFAPVAMLHDDIETDFGRGIDYTQPFTGGPLALGFDRFFGIAGSLDMPPYAFLDQDLTVGVPDREKEYYLTEQRRGCRSGALTSRRSTSGSSRRRQLRRAAGRAVPVLPRDLGAASAQRPSGLHQGSLGSRRRGGRRVPPGSPCGRAAGRRSSRPEAAGGFSEPSITDLFATGSGKAHPAPPWDAEHPDGQLYDVMADPAETVNLWLDRPEVAAELYKTLCDVCRDDSSGFTFGVPVGS